MSSDLPRVSIALPVYNGEKYLAIAIDSVLSQDFTDYEFIINDNNSSDATAEICKRYAERDPRIRYFRNDVTVDAVTNWHIASTYARAPLFVWIASDDLWLPGTLGRLVSLLEANPDAVLAQGKVVPVDKDGARIPGCHYTELYQPCSHRLLRLAQLIWSSEARGKACFIYGVMRLEAIRAIDQLRDYGGTEWGVDNRIVFQLAKQGRFVIHPEPVMCKRIHSGAQSQNEAEPLRWGFVNLEQERYFNGYREEFPAEAPWARLLLATVLRAKMLVWFTWHFYLRRRNVVYVLERTVRRSLDRVYEQFPSPLVALYRRLKRLLFSGQ